MEVGHYPTEINQVCGYNVWCTLCSRPFDTIAEKNAHILDHFEQEICEKCDQNLIRIGDNLYILHGTITCIGPKIKIETEEDVLNSSATSPDDLLVEDFQMEVENISIDHGQLNYKSECDIEETNQYNTESTSFLEESDIKIEVVDECEEGEKEIQSIDNAENNTECDKTGKTEIGISKSNQNIKTITCKYEGCGEIINANSIRSHIIHKHVEKGYKCNVCEKAFATKFQKERHMKIHDPTRKLFKCDLCGVPNIVKSTLVNHLMQKFKCEQCHQTFCTDIQLKKHYRSHKTIQQRLDEIRKKNRMKMHKCKIEGCNEMLSKNDHSRQMTLKHKTIQFECDICKKKFVEKKQMRDHILNMHDPSSKKFKCDLCGSSFISKAKLNRHFRRVHIIQYNCVCSECGKAFRTNHQLNVHSNSHTGAKPYKCTFEGCSKRFARHSQRYEHLRTHTGEKPYQCIEKECNRRFAYGIDLKRHKFNAHRIYTKKFPCNICSEIFPENVLLKKHMKKHGVHQ